MKKHHHAMFAPVLPEFKIEAIQSLNRGPVSKYLFDWDEPWWTDERPILFADQCAESNKGNFADWIRGVSCVRPPHGPNLLVMCFISGEASLAADQLTDEQVNTHSWLWARTLVSSTSVRQKTAANKQKL